MRTVGGAIAGADVSALEQQVADAKATADQALATGQNARQMVLNRDGTLQSLQQTASQFGSVTAAADATHQALQDEITALTTRMTTQEQRAMTVGPKGDPGNDGKSAYQLARDAGYGGTQTQWLATLIGAKGDKGDPGTPADTTRVTALETGLAAEIINRQSAVTAEATARTNADAAEVTARQQADATLQAALDLLAAKNVTWETASYTATAIVSVGGNLSLTFTWQAAMATAPAKVRLLSPVPLANIVYGTPTTTGCTVTAKVGTLAVAIGATFHLIAIRYA